MPTFGIKTEISMSGENFRSDYNSFYKAFSQNRIKMDAPVSILAGESGSFDLSGSSFAIVICDDYGLENEVLDMTFTDTDSNTFIVKNIGFMLLNFSNLMSMSVKNTGASKVDVNIVY